MAQQMMQPACSWTTAVVALLDNPRWKEAYMAQIRTPTLNYELLKSPEKTKNNLP